MHVIGFCAECPVSDLRGLSISHTVDAFLPPIHSAFAPFLTAYQQLSWRQW